MWGGGGVAEGWWWSREAWWSPQAQSIHTDHSALSRLGLHQKFTSGALYSVTTSIILHMDGHLQWPMEPLEINI